MQRNRLQIQPAIKIDGCDDVSLRIPVKLDGSKPVTQFGSTHCNVGTIPLTVGPPPGVAAGVAGVMTPPD